MSNQPGALPAPQVAQPAQAVAQVDAKTQDHIQKISLSTNGITDFGATEMSRVRRSLLPQTFCRPCCIL